MTPSFSACLRWAGWVALAIFVVVLVMVGGAKLLRGEPLPQHWWTRPHEILIGFAALTIGMALLVYGVGYLFASKLGETSLIGVSFWGRGIEVPLSSITGIEPVSVEGIPMLLVKSTATKSNLHVMALGLGGRPPGPVIRSRGGSRRAMTDGAAASTHSSS